MATIAPTRQRSNSFRIHQDLPSTEDTQMNDENDHGHHAHEPEDDEDVETEEQVDDQQEQDYQESEYSESSEDEAAVDINIQHDMEKLQSAFPGFRNQYRLIKRIGEGKALWRSSDLVWSCVN